MKVRISEDVKLDIGLVSQPLDDTNATGKYHPVKDYPRICAVLNGGAMAATKTTKIELLQAKDNGGTDAKGHEIGGAYQLAENAAFKLTYFMNEIGLDQDNSKDFQRLQVDLQLKF